MTEYCHIGVSTDCSWNMYQAEVKKMVRDLLDQCDITEISRKNDLIDVPDGSAGYNRKVPLSGRFTLTLRLIPRIGVDCGMESKKSNSGERHIRKVLRQKRSSEKTHEF